MATINIIFVSIFYFLLAWLGLLFSNVEGTVTIIWPASGFAIFALLIFKNNPWPGILIGSFLSGFLIRDSLLLSFLIALGNTSEALLGLYLLKKTNFVLSLESINDYIKLIFCCALIAPIASAVIGVSSLYGYGFLPSSEYLKAFFHWWMADSVGVLMVAPSLLIAKFSKLFNNHSQSYYFEIISLYIVSFIIGQIIFFEWFQQYLGAYAYGFFSFAHYHLGGITF